jgi:hypothetical protein
MRMPGSFVERKCAVCEEENLQRQEESPVPDDSVEDIEPETAPAEEVSSEDIPSISIQLPSPLTIRVNGVMYTSPTFLVEGPNGRIVDIAPYTGTGVIDFPLAALESLGIPILSYYHFHFGRARQFLGQHFESAYALSGGTSFIRNALHYGYITADDVTLFGAPSSYNLEHYGGIPHLNIVANPMDIGTMINMSYFNYPLVEGHNNPAVMFTINAPFNQNPFEAFTNLGGAIYHALSGDLYNLPNVTHRYPRFHSEPDAAIGSPATTTQISRKAESPGISLTPWVKTQLNKRKGMGHPLPPHVQDFMESRFGTDFSGVKVHTDFKAVQLSRELNAKAFTHGSDIYFNQGKFDPGTNEGKRLMAHELTHVVQQGGSFVQPIKGVNTLMIQKTSRLCTEERPYSEDCSRYIGSGSSSCEFYKCREANNECRCNERGYYIGYGLKYCDRFNRITRPILSPAGQRWIDQTTACLQNHINSHVAWDAPCSDVKKKAFESHPGCYVRSGICFLPPSDWDLILATIDMSDNDLKQTIITGISCIFNWLPLAFPVHSLSAGGGFRGLMERDRERLRREMGVRLP